MGPQGSRSRGERLSSGAGTSKGMGYEAEHRRTPRSGPGGRASPQKSGGRARDRKGGGGESRRARSILAGIQVLRRSSSSRRERSRWRALGSGHLGVAEQIPGAKLSRARGQAPHISCNQEGSDAFDCDRSTSSMRFPDMLRRSSTAYLASRAFHRHRRFDRAGRVPRRQRVGKNWSRVHHADRSNGCSPALPRHRDGTPLATGSSHRSTARHERCDALSRSRRWCDRSAWTSAPGFTPGRSRWWTGRLPA